VQEPLESGPVEARLELRCWEVIAAQPEQALVQKDLVLGMSH